LDKGSRLIDGANTRLGWKSQIVANALAYYATESIADVKTPMIHAPRQVRTIKMI